MHYAFATPVSEIEADEVLCEKCKTKIEEEAYHLIDAYYCESCVGDLEDDVEIDAVAFAEKNCRIAHPLPKYDASQEFKCTPEEYANGNRESNTPNAYLCRCRHKFTNYDELIRELDRSEPHDRILYVAIHGRVMQLIKEALGDDAKELMSKYIWEDKP
ncbi:MAG: hypothetical protein HS116_19230 [Planctomycetes bacterium]|nr:hypothetical protein [Planctomycetota bacterium]